MFVFTILHPVVQACRPLQVCLLRRNRVQKSEFTVKNAYHYNHTDAIRWILSHVWRHRVFVILAIVLSLVSNILSAQGPVLIGQAAQEIIQPTLPDALLKISLAILVVLVGRGAIGLAQNLSIETLAQRLEASAREELYGSLLGKSQTFHDRQR